MTSKQIFIVALLFCSVGVALGGAPADSTLADIAGYRQWTRVTDKPTFVVDGSVGG